MWWIDFCDFFPVRLRCTSEGNEKIAWVTHARFLGALVARCELVFVCVCVCGGEK